LQSCRVSGVNNAICCNSNTSSSKRYAGKAGATAKSGTPNAGNAASYAYTGKAGATAKNASPNAGNGDGQCYADKGTASGKSRLLNAGHGAAGQVNVDEFSVVVSQRSSKTSGSVVITAKAVHVQFDFEGCLDGVGGLASQPCFQFGDAGSGIN
jgi:hypothetical protein